MKAENQLQKKRGYCGYYTYNFFRSNLQMLEAKIGRTRTTPAEQDE
jgi:hypothetical protein